MADSLQLQRAGILLEQCAILAKCIQQLAVDGADGSPQAHKFVCIELLAAQLGYHADLGGEVVGKGACFGDAEDWMLPAEYFTPEGSKA